MTCSAVAEPGADFIWIKDNRTLHPSDDVQIFNSDHHSSLQLYIYDESVFGDYECRATNMLGTMARVIVLEQATKPAAPTFKIKVSLRVNCLRRRAASFLVCFINVPFHFFPPSPTHTMERVGLSIKKKKRNVCRCLERIHFHLLGVTRPLFFALCNQGTFDWCVTVARQVGIRNAFQLSSNKKIDISSLLAFEEAVVFFY